MAQKSIVSESADIQRAVTLINLGARLQVLESVTSLSYERLLRLYKEVAGKSPSKGQLPFSVCTCNCMAVGKSRNGVRLSAPPQAGSHCCPLVRLVLW